MYNGIKDDTMVFIISEEAQMFLQTDDKVKRFESVKYKSNGRTMSLLECIRTIAKGKYCRVDIEDNILSLSDLKRTYNIKDFDCPEPSMYDFLTSVTIETPDGNFVIEYHFDSDETDLSSVAIYHREKDGKLEEIARVDKQAKSNGEFDTPEELKDRLTRKAFWGEEK